MAIILTFIVLVACFNILSTLIMLVLEKTKEISILKSMGARDASVMKIFVVEGLTIGAIGTAMGLLLGLASCSFIERFGLQLEGGEMASLVGPSGVGKSTFLHVIGTLDPPTGGEVLFDGRDAFAMTEEELAAFRNRSVGFVFQFHYLLPEFTALQNASMPGMINRL